MNGCVILKQQQGTVLVIALLIVTIMTGIAISVSGNFQLTMKRAEQRLFVAQMKQYYFGLEHFIIWGLNEDHQEDKEKHGTKPYDHLAEAWATQSVMVPLESGTIDATLEDAQGRFNLNTLVGRPEPYNVNGSVKQRFTVSQRRFLRLLQTLPGEIVDELLAKEITEAAIDWIDLDSDTTGLGGAESSYYAGLDKPYNPANQLFSSVSELRLLKGMTEELYLHLLPLVIVLPDTDADINVNTAPIEVLRTITSVDSSVPLTEEDAGELANSRPAANGGLNNTGSNDSLEERTEGFHSIEDFLATPEALSVYGNEMPLGEGLTTGTGYFLLSSEISIGDIQRKDYSLLQRKNVQSRTVITVVRRASGKVL